MILHYHYDVKAEAQRAVIREKARPRGLQAERKRGILVGSYVMARPRAAPTGPDVVDRILVPLPTR